MLPAYLDMGLTLYKLGEEANVPLPEFTLDGPERSGLRYIHRRLEKEGYLFEVLPADQVHDVLPKLRTISDAWLTEKNTREKGFSLGRFDEGYLSNFPVCVIKQQGKIVAFANLWAGTDKQQLSLDLMRFGSQAPRSVMEYLFISLMLWGKQQGYQSFKLAWLPSPASKTRLLPRCGIGSARWSSGMVSIFTTLKDYASTRKNSTQAGNPAISLVLGVWLCHAS